MKLGLEGKRAIVTGGSRGIGLAIAKGLAAEGCSLGLLARGEEDLAKAAAELRDGGAEVEFVTADVTNGQEHDEAVAALAKALGGIDIAIANAGGSQPGDAMAPDEVWTQQFELNFLSAVRLHRVAAPLMEKAGGGAMVIISSISGLEAFGRASYVSTKAALHGFAKSAALEGARKGIRVNCVAPGAILFPGGSWDKRRLQDKALFKQVEESIAWKRLGTPEEVADIVTFLASPKASWVTGAVVVVDGGQTHRIA